jgi:hypothetical protein
MSIKNQNVRIADQLNRRIFLGRSGLGALAFPFLTQGVSVGAAEGRGEVSGLPHHPAKAKRIIYLFQSGAPSQMDLFDPKPEMEKRRGENLPDSIRQGQRLTTMTSGQSTFPVAPSVFKFEPRGKSGMMMSELLPNMGSVADEFCMIRSMHTEAINHDPAITFCQTGSQLAGRPSIGSWMSYGLGSENQDLPAYVVLTSFGSGRPDDQPLYDRLWGAGFLPSRHQGVKFRNSGDAVLYLSDPPGVTRSMRRQTLDRLKSLNEERATELGDPEIQARIAQYEMAFRMQSSVPDLLNTSDEPAHILEMYGKDVHRPGSYGLGPPWRFTQRAARAMQRHRPGNCRLDQGLEGPRIIRGHSHRLGRGIWPDDLLARGSFRDQLRTRSSPALFHHPFGWGGNTGRLHFG